jgi:phosphatidylglycerol---prolipoprotein diacylglyceryl transferase
VLPFVFLDESKLGPFHPYGLACALGFFLWDWAVMRMAVRRGFDRADFRICTLWVLVMGTFFSWWIDAVFYHPPGRSVVSTLFAFQGFSSTGAIVGAVVGGIFWSRIRIHKDDGRWKMARREKPIALLPPTEVVVATWPLAWASGRLGCSLIHDHPGVTVAKGTLGSLFAVAWPLGPDDGTHHVWGPLHVVTGGSSARFDLGLLEFFILAGIAIYFATTWKKDWKVGSYTIVGGLIYGPLRFVLDFLRDHDGPGGDLRHGGLTFAQYWSLAVIGIALFLLAKRRREATAEPATDGLQSPS